MEGLNLLVPVAAQEEEVEWRPLTLNTLEVQEPQVKETMAVRVGAQEPTLTCRPEAEAEARVPWAETLLQVRVVMVE